MATYLNFNSYLIEQSKSGKSKIPVCEVSTNDFKVRLRLLDKYKQNSLRKK